MRMKLEFYNQLTYSSGQTSNKSMVKGIEIHSEKNSWAKSHDRLKVLYQLKYGFKLPYTRSIGNIEVRGVFDNLRVVWNPKTKQKYVSFVEYKTTSRIMWRPEIEASLFQLETYIWIMKPYIEKLGWKLHSRHYLEIYSQKTGELMKRIMVETPNDIDMEEGIEYIIRVLRGQEAMGMPYKSICRICPKYCKCNCDYYKETKNYEGYR